MDFQTAVRTCLQKYADFKGRAARPEFWFFQLFCFIVNLIMQGLSLVLPDLALIIGLLFGLGTLIPSLAVGARRLHDTDRSGWWQLLAFIPILGWIALIVFWAQRSAEGPNRFDMPAAGAA